jgi:hypothetical protein
LKENPRPSRHEKHKKEKEFVPCTPTPASIMSNFTHKKRGRTETDYKDRRDKRPRTIRNNAHRDHVCEVTLQRLFLERQEWRAVTKSLQEQIDVLSDRPMIRRFSAAPSDGPVTATAPPPRPRNTMPNDHPLLPFVRECLVERNWESRAMCGAVRRAYKEWHAKQATNSNMDRKKIMGHIRFSNEMRQYWPRKGSQARSYYSRIELEKAEEQEEKEGEKDEEEEEKDEEEEEEQEEAEEYV